MDAFPDEGETYRPSEEAIFSEIYRNTWLKVIGEKLETLGDSREDFAKRCNFVRQAYMEMGDLVLKAARRGSIAQPYFLPWDQFWRKSPPEFDTWGPRSKRRKIYGKLVVGRAVT